MDVKIKDNIAVFLPSMQIGGAETVAANLCNCLVDHYNVNLIVIAGEIAFDINPQVKTWKLYKRNISNGFVQKLSVPVAGWKYYKLCKKLNVKTSLSFLPQANFINAFGKICNAPYKIILSQRTNESEYLNMLSPVKRAVQKLYINFFYRKADIINTNSNHALLDLQNAFGLKNATSVIYNPISKIPHDYEEPQLMKGPPDKFRLLYVANFRHEKNHLMLLKAISLLSIKDKVRLYLIGSGDADKVKSFIREHQLEDNVVLLGFLHKPFNYIKASDCCVISSDFEGFSNALLEALACGKPVISTATLGGIEMLSPGIKNIIPEEPYLAEYGILTKIADPEQMKKAIEMLYFDKSLRKHYANIATERTAAFAPAVIAQKFIELINN